MVSYATFDVWIFDIYIYESNSVLEGANFANNVPQSFDSTEENTMNFQQDNPSPGQDLNPGLTNTKQHCYPLPRYDEYNS